MKILYIVTKSDWGGAQKHVYDLAVAMKEAGHEVWAAAGGGGPLINKLEQAGIYAFSMPSLGRDVSLRNDAVSFMEMRRIIRDKNPDILHLHSPKAAGLGALAGRLSGVKKIIMTVHGWTWNEERPLRHKAAIVLFSWLTAMLCHKIAVISDHDMVQGLRLPFLKRKLILIRPGLKPATVMSVDGAKQFMAKIIGMDYVEFNRRFAIMTSAELHANKGLSYLIEAMPQVLSRHPEAVSVIIGDGQEKERLSALIKEKRVESGVFLAGYVAAAAEYAKAFSLFVLPSVKEGLPYALLEAGAASLPAVATTVGGIPELVDDMRSGILVQPGKPSELAHAISFMIEHSEERRRYGAALHDKVLKDFSLKRMVEEVKKAYET
ncbi:glycosyltransferase [Patescibacteria group bacterium]|nr:glycosyltransferase [Patescibacteria group bacterium]